MPRHKQVAQCRHGGPTNDLCGCEHCTLSVCSVCGAYEGSLTTDCPGEHVFFDKQQEIYETNLDFSEDRGWHQGEPWMRRSPRFEKDMPLQRILPELLGQPTGVTKIDLDPAVAELSKIVGTAVVDPPGVGAHTPRWTSIDAPQGALRVVGCSCGWQCPSSEQNSDTAFTLHAAYAHFGPTNTVSNTRGHHKMQRKDELAAKAIAWVLADRIVTQHSADLERIQEEADAHLGPRKRLFACGHVAPAVGGGDWCKPCGSSQKIIGPHPAGFRSDDTQLDERAQDLLGKLERAKIDFHLADQHAQKCDDEFRQAARQLTVLEHDHAAAKIKDP